MRGKDRRAVSARTASAAGWLVGARLGTRAIDFLSLLLLARLLTPADFGLVAVAMTLVTIVEAITELPLGQVLLRRRSIRRQELDTAFTLGALRGLTLAAVLGALALPFARLYGDPRLILLICVLSLAPAMRGLLSPRMALFARRIDFRRDFAIDLVSKSAALIVAAGLAFGTRSYWSIAAATLTTPAAMMAMSYVLAPYRPRFSLASWSQFRGFLGWSTAAQTAMAISWQCDRLLLGRFVPPAAFGAFSLANDLAYMPEQALIKPIVRPLFSAFLHVADDPARLREAYAKAATTVLAVGLPIMLALSLLADPVVRLALGPRWLGAVPILRWLPLTLIPPLFTAPLVSLAYALGDVRITLRLNLADLAMRLPLIAAGAIRYGIAGVIVARAVTALLMALISMRRVRALIGMPLVEQVLGLRRVGAAGLASTLVLVLAEPLLAGRGGLALLAGTVGSGALALAVYVAVLALLWHRAGRPAGVEHTVAGQIAAVRRRLGSSPAARGA